VRAIIKQVGNSIDDQKSERNGKSKSMLYTIPDYYHEFTCVAGKCEDTCCAGWQIVVDDASLENYKNETGTFAERLKESVNWEEGTFKQDKDRRCAFLNQSNLCDMYTALGEESLCRTCKLYPRHIEEFEDVREVTLSVSCPEVARTLMNKKEPVHFLTYETDEEEDYEDFDPFLYSKLLDARDVMIEILQDREKKLNLRAALILAIARDLQECIDEEDIFSMDDVFDYYQAEEGVRKVKNALAEVDYYTYSRKMFQNQYQMEHLRADWESYLQEAEKLLYRNVNEKNRQKTVS
jgi:lysine-N-methylase